MQDTNAFFATAHPVRLFFRVALPGMVSMLAMSIYSIIEGVFLGQKIGEEALAAVALAMPFVMINFSLADLIGVGSSVPISIALGRGDKKRADNFFTCSVILIFLASLVMGLLMFFGAPYFMQLMGSSGEAAGLATQYVRVYACFSPITTVVFAMDNYLRISGFVKGSMLLNIFMSVLTALLVFLFLFVGGMNVEGSALATCMSMSLCAVLGSIPFLRGKAVLHFTRPRFNGGMFKTIFACGSPVFLNNIAGRVASIVMNGALLAVGGEELGDTAVAAFSVMMYASDIIQPMLYGMSDAVSPAIGYNWGARKLGRVKSLTKCAFLACAAVSLVGTALMFFLPKALCSLFVKPEETALLSMSVSAMRLFGLAYLTRWVGFVVQSFFSAIEKPLPASVLSVCSAMVFPLVFIGALWPLGLTGLWLNLAATSAAVALLSLIMLRVSQRGIARAIDSK